MTKDQANNIHMGLKVGQIDLVQKPQEDSRPLGFLFCIKCARSALKTLNQLQISFFLSRNLPHLPGSPLVDFV